MDIMRSFPERYVFGDKAACHQGFELICKSTSIRNTRPGHDFIPGKAAMAGTQEADNGLVLLRIDKEGTEQQVELVLQHGLLGKEETVDILGQRVFFAKSSKVVGNSAQDHIRLRNIIVGHHNSFVQEEGLALGQGEWSQVYLQREPAVQAPFVVDEVVFHPGGGAAADDE